MLSEPPSGQALLQIVSSDGHVVASTTTAATATWSATAGPNGAYWVDSGTVRRLALDGAVTTVASIPASVSAFLVSPDGAEIAYATSERATPSQGSAGPDVNSIYVESFGGTPRLLVQRLSDPSHPSNDAPASWDYYLMSWSKAGILIARAPQGGCGCGPFDMQMQSADSALIDASTGATTDITNDSACPLSGASADGVGACFATGGGSSGTTALHILRQGSVAQQFSLSGHNVAGNAVFAADDSAVAYLTIPLAGAQCGGTWASTLRFLELATGAATDASVNGLSTLRWSGTGAMFGVVHTAAASTLVSIDPATLRTATLIDGPATMSLAGVIQQ